MFPSGVVNDCGLPKHIHAIFPRALPLLLARHRSQQTKK